MSTDDLQHRQAKQEHREKSLIHFIYLLIKLACLSMLDCGKKLNCSKATAISESRVLEVNEADAIGWFYLPKF